MNWLSGFEDSTERKHALYLLQENRRCYDVIRRPTQRYPDRSLLNLCAAKAIFGYVSLLERRRVTTTDFHVLRREVLDNYREVKQNDVEHERRLLTRRDLRNHIIMYNAQIMER